VLLLNECLLLFISLSTQSGNFWIHPPITFAAEGATLNDLLKSGPQLTIVMETFKHAELTVPCTEVKGYVPPQFRHKHQTFMLNYTHAESMHTFE
jgi:hypothetical protein